MKRIYSLLLALIAITMVGCNTPNMHDEKLTPSTEERTISISSDIVAYETRPVFKIKCQWTAKAGVYRECLKGERGCYFISDENNITFKSSTGKIIEETGGLFIPFDSAKNPWIFIFADYGPMGPGALMKTFLTLEGNPLLRAEIEHFNYAIK
jgi:hypothetical protein